MTCTSCGDHPKHTNKDFTKAVIEINNPESLVLLRKVVIPASMGTEEQVPATIGKYRNVILQYEANKHVYFYSSDGIPTSIEAGVPKDVIDRIENLEDGLELEETRRTIADEGLQSNINTVSNNLSAEITARQNGDNGLQNQIDAITVSSDVKDVVGTKAQLNDYDTSTLGDNDIIKVLQDESESNATTYYRWNSTTQQFTLIGEEGPYYTKGQADVLLNAKQNTLIAGDNIQIIQDVISASGGSVTELTSSDYNYPTNNPTYVALWLLEPGIYYSDGTAEVRVTTSSSTASTAPNIIYLVSSPSVDNEKSIIKTTQTRSTLYSVNINNGVATNEVDIITQVVQATGTSTTNVMSQNAVTSMVFADPATQTKIKIGAGTSSSEGADAVEIGHNASSEAQYAVCLGNNTQANRWGNIAIGSGASALSANGNIAIGTGATSSGKSAIALGTNANANTQGQFDVSAGTNNDGYNNSNYRLLTGLYDPQSAHDAATKGYVDNANNLSTTEINTGATWVDGSTIYKTTVHYGALPDNQAAPKPHNISNIDKIVRIEGVAIPPNNTSYTYPLPHAALTTSDNIYVLADGTNVSIRTGVDRTSLDGYVTLYYTKSQ